MRHLSFRNVIRAGIHRMTTRHVGEIFLSPAKVLRRACVIRHADKIAQRSEAESPIAGAAPSEALVCRGAVATSMSIDQDGTFIGGILKEDCSDLIEEAIHRKNQTYTISNGRTTWRSEKMQRLNHESLRNTTSKEPPEITASCIYGGILFNAFGHFVLESLGRLWAYEKVLKLDPYVVFYAPWGTPDYYNKRNYVRQILDGFRIPANKIIIITSPVRFRWLLIPAQKYGDADAWLLQPDPAWLNFARSFRPRSITKPIPSGGKIYVSRSRLQGVNGRVVAEQIFESWLSQFGYTIIYPEELPLDAQLRLYQNADRIIFCEGSAMHACILLPQLKAHVAVIARRRPAWDGSLIINHFKGYGNKVEWIDSITSQIEAGLDSWSALAEVDWIKVSERLCEAGFLTRPFNEYSKADHKRCLETELSRFLTAAAQERKFIDFIYSQRSVF